MSGRSRAHHAGGFTLVELMVSISILLLLLSVLFSLTDATRLTWSYTKGKVEQFRSARQAFESITRQLGQATLNTYWDYDDPAAPKRYVRQSELRFITGNASALTGNPDSPTHAVFFQAPLGFSNDPSSYSHMETLLNTWGYFIEFGDDSELRPPFITPQISPYRHRFRLMEMMEPSESLTLYRYTNGQPDYKGLDWFKSPLNAQDPPIRVLAENVISLVLLPQLSAKEDSSGTRLAPAYSYDSTATNPDPAINPKNQLPPIVLVTIVAVDEGSYARFQQTQTGAGIPQALGLGSLFQSAGDLESPSGPGFARDLQTLQDELVRRRIDFRVFQSSVSIHSAKWSREQKN